MGEDRESVLLRMRFLDHHPPQRNHLTILPLPLAMAMSMVQKMKYLARVVLGVT